MEIISIINKKGGVAKTTTTLNMAFGIFKREHKKILLIDTDSQCSFSFTMGADTSKPSILDIIIKDIDIKKSIQIIKKHRFYKS